MPFVAHPAHPSSRDAGGQNVVREVAGHYGAGCHERVTTDGYPAHDGRVGADGTTLAEKRSFERVSPAHLGPWIANVGKDR
jgi:hypothetical protein